MKEIQHYSSEELKDIQQIELACLKEIICICKTIDVDYFAIGGTALGAVRHNGFIPWDDDIDIGMTRANYERFLREAPRLLPQGYYLQSPYGNDNNPYLYTKIRVDNTVFMEYSNHRLGIHHGIYVDVFPFDEVPDNEEDNIKQFIAIQRLSRLFTWRQSPDVSKPPVNMKERFKAGIRYFIHLILQGIPCGWIKQRIERISTMYNGTGQQAIACLLFPKRKCEYGKFSTFFPLIQHEFFDVSISIPQKYDIYLTSHYGDWKQLPPPSLRVGHKPYRVYVNTGMLKKRMEG